MGEGFRHKKRIEFPYTAWGHGRFTIWPRSVWQLFLILAVAEIVSDLASELLPNPSSSSASFRSSELYLPFTPARRSCQRGKDCGWQFARREYLPSTRTPRGADWARHRRQCAVPLAMSCLVLMTKAEESGIQAVVEVESNMIGWLDQQDTSQSSENPRRSTTGDNTADSSHRNAAAKREGKSPESMLEDPSELKKKYSEVLTAARERGESRAALPPGANPVARKCLKSFGFSSNELSNQKGRLTFCKQHESLTCCDKKDTDEIRRSSASVGLAGDAFSVDCRDFILKAQCSKCDAAVGVGTRATEDGKPILCGSFCREWYAACKDEFFGPAESADAFGLTPCGKQSLVCSKLSSLVKDSQALCERFGFKTRSVGECFDGTGAPPSQKDRHTFTTSASKRKAPAREIQKLPWWKRLLASWERRLRRWQYEIASRSTKGMLIMCCAMALPALMMALSSSEILQAPRDMRDRYLSLCFSVVGCLQSIAERLRRLRRPRPSRQGGGANSLAAAAAESRANAAQQPVSSEHEGPPASMQSQ